jgi:hypothetical protein
MRTSRMRQLVPFSRPELRISSAEENTSAVNPADLKSPLSASRTEASSSTMEILESFGTTASRDAGDA